MHISVEGLPALGKSEILSVFRLYYSDQAVVFPELVKDVVERERIDLFRERDRLSEAIWAALPEREQAVRHARAAGKTVIEESHLGVHAAYAAALGDRAFVDAFRRREPEVRWPDRFVRLAAPISTSLSRQEARGEPRYSVAGPILTQMLSSLDTWHHRRKSDLRAIDADRPPAVVLGELAAAARLTYPSEIAADVLPYLLLLGRPAAGKSELIQFLNGLPASERAAAYRIGHLRGEDDFPLLWQLFVEDDLWERVGRGRLHSRRSGENYAVATDHLWPFLILQLGERIAGHPAGAGETVLVEFARGGASGYQDALAHLPPDLLGQAAVLYLDVTFEESWRRNLARYDRARRAGILTHSVPREEMERTYARDDWAALALEPSGYLEAGGVQVPYVTVSNTPEPITPDEFRLRFAPALGRLWDLTRSRNRRP